MDFVLGLPRGQRSTISDVFWKMVNTHLNFSRAYHPQTNGTPGVVNKLELLIKSFINILHCLVGDLVKAWDQKTDFSLFQVVYSLFLFQRKCMIFLKGYMEFIKFVHDKLVRANSKYKHDANQKRMNVDFSIVLTKNHFSVGEYNTLLAKKIGIMEIVEKINSIVYRLKLSSHIRCYDNSSDDEVAANSRTKGAGLKGGRSFTFWKGKNSCLITLITHDTPHTKWHRHRHLILCNRRHVLQPSIQWLPNRVDDEPNLPQLIGLHHVPPVKHKRRFWHTLVNLPVIQRLELIPLRQYAEPMSTLRRRICIRLHAHLIHRARVYRLQVHRMVPVKLVHR
ncbi:hypothetical protein LXL04_008690 [Taraxacum kok-saghyz]